VAQHAAHAPAPLERGAACRTTCSARSTSAPSRAPVRLRVGRVGTLFFKSVPRGAASCPRVDAARARRGPSINVLGTFDFGSIGSLRSTSRRPGWHALLKSVPRGAASCPRADAAQARFGQSFNVRGTFVLGSLGSPWSTQCPSAGLARSYRLGIRRVAAERCWTSREPRGLPRGQTHKSLSLEVCLGAERRR
jgi:hypothetical protein